MSYSLIIIPTIFTCMRAAKPYFKPYLTIDSKQVYPTTIRGLALGITSASARIGCIVTPFIAEVNYTTIIHYT